MSSRDWLKPAWELKQTVSGKEFQILTILHAKTFWRTLLVHRVLYSVQTWPLIDRRVTFLPVTVRWENVLCFQIRCRLLLLSVDAFFHSVIFWTVLASFDTVICQQTVAKLRFAPLHFFSKCAANTLEVSLTKPLFWLYVIPRYWAYSLARARYYAEYRMIDYPNVSAKIDTTLPDKPLAFTHSQLHQISIDFQNPFTSQISLNLKYAPS